MPKLRKNKSIKKSKRYILKQIGVAILKSGSKLLLMMKTGIKSFPKFIRYLKSKGVLYEIIEIIGMGLLEVYAPNAIQTAASIILDSADIAEAFSKANTYQQKKDLVVKLAEKYGRDALPSVVVSFIDTVNEIDEYKDKLAIMDDEERLELLANIAIRIGYDHIPRFAFELVDLIIRSYNAGSQVRERHKKTKTRYPITRDTGFLPNDERPNRARRKRRPNAGLRKKVYRGEADVKAAPMQFQRNYF